MTIHIRYFAALRDRRGLAEETIESEAFGTVRELIDRLIEAHRLDLASALIRPAVNGAFVADDHPLRDGDEVALIPPVAGG